ncbi:protein GRAVITROPIC IN THE LIGHT 1-like [Abrus precatorius]|uniref:Protein GRAVITROPIC IN THE LIGHT 1-like n=1 Tax=Abrus precatorius TaxID=3816 RepID=A0A8B8MIR7_ABRPR|nr:protein GRAVITROPIC IN THE LIGHT 1-like [Abrus precatorius]
MTRKVSNFSDLIQRVTASCMLQPLADDKEESQRKDYDENKGGYENEEEKKLKQIMEEVFEAVSAMKKAYATLQEAHCPWDPHKVSLADVAVVAQLKKLSLLRERFRRRETVMHGLKTKELHLRNLNLSVLGSEAQNKPRRNRPHTKTKLACTTQFQGVASAPCPQMFEATMVEVKEASKCFTSLLLTLMQNANWDIPAAVRSIEASTTTTTNGKYNALATDATSTMVSAQHAKYALQSYIFRKIFQGFDHETFYVDGTLSTLLNPHQFRRDCFSQYQDMKSMDPSQLLGILPTCNFGKFCANKYLSIVHPKMEESLFGNLEQHSLVSEGNHPRTKFYNEFLGVAKAVWLLHLLAFSLDPTPTQFEACRGAEFHPHYMESVVKFEGGRVFVGFPVSPGFRLGNGSIVKARVYLMATT